jgi:hypothetical protein
VFEGLTDKQLWILKCALERDYDACKQDGTYRHLLPEIDALYEMIPSPERDDYWKEGIDA